MSLTKPNGGYLANLTPLRGIAAILTVIFHVDLFAGNGGNLLVKRADSMSISKLYLMVDFFFVLSGFIMLHVYGKMFKDNVRPASFKQFSVARFARIYPLHFVTLLFLIAVRIWFLNTGKPDDPFAASSFTWVSVPTNLLLIQSMNVHNWFTWNNAAWSISTEWWMYMLFPFLVRPFFKLNNGGRILIALLCLGGYLLIIFYLQRFVTVPPALSFIKADGPAKSLDIAYQFGFFRCLFGFILGMITYLAYQSGHGKKLFGKGITLAILALGFFTCIHFAVLDVFSAIFFPLIILSAAYGSKNMNALFSKKAFQRIGDWSYSIYLVHQPLIFGYLTVMSVVAPAKPGTAQPLTMLMGWIICIVFLAITLLVASLTYRFIEVPARNWINRKFGSAEHVKTPAVAGT